MIIARTRRSIEDSWPFEADFPYHQNSLINHLVKTREHLRLFDLRATFVPIKTTALT